MIWLVPLKLFTEWGTVHSRFVRVMCSNRRYPHYEKIGSEVKPGKSWFTSCSRAGLSEWHGEISHLHYLYCLISPCISFIYFLNPVDSWICVSYLCKPQIFCSSFYYTHYLFIFHELSVIMGLMFLLDYTFHEGRSHVHLMTCYGSSIKVVHGTVFLSSSVPSIDAGVYFPVFKIL